MERVLDAIVIGGGPAGLSAASWLGRYRRSVLLLDAGDQRNLVTHAIHGYLGIDPCKPADFLERAREGFLRYPHAELRAVSVTAVSGSSGAFVVETDEGTERARRLVLATGVRDIYPDVEGFFDHYGETVFHCPSCDGYEARDRRVVVFGWSDHVTGFARDLLTWASSVAIVTEGPSLRADDEQRAQLRAAGIEVFEDDAIALLGDPGKLEGVKLRGGDTVPCEYAFFSFAHVPRSEIAASLGCELDDEGYVVIDRDSATTVDGVYAAGDCTPGTQLVQVAAAQGTNAGIKCAMSLRDAREGG